MTTGRPKTEDVVNEQMKKRAGMFPDEQTGVNPFADAVEEIKALSSLDWLRLSPNALTIDADLSEDEWFILIEKIESLKHRYQWYLGDAMVYGVQRKYGETDAQIQRLMKITRKGKSTLNDYYKTALLFEIHERSQNLLFEQHRVLAIEFSQQTPEHHSERLRWLRIAETEGLSGRKIQAAIAAQLPAELSPEEYTAQLQAGMLEGVTVEYMGTLGYAPALSDEIDPTEIEKIAARPVKEVKKTFREFTRHIESDTLRDMPRGDLYALLVYVQDKYNQRRKMGG